MKFSRDDASTAAIGAVFVGMLLLTGAYSLAVWKIWKWVESGYK